MTGIITGPDNEVLSFDALPNTNFRLLFPKAPFLVMFLQNINLPAVLVNSVSRPTRYVDINEIGEKMIFEPFTATFLVDKAFKNYREIFNWMKRMTVAGTSVGDVDNPVLYVSDTTSFRFIGAWPMSLGSVQFITNATDVTYLTCDVTFNYDYIELT